MWKKAMGLTLAGVLGMVAVCGLMCSSTPPPSVPAQVVVLPFEVPAESPSPIASGDIQSRGEGANEGGLSAAPGPSDHTGGGDPEPRVTEPETPVALRPGVLSAEQQAHHARVAERVGVANAACASGARVACSGDLCVVGGTRDTSRWGRWMRRPSLILEDLVVGPLGLPSGEGTCAHASYAVLRTASIEGSHRGQPCTVVRRTQPAWVDLSPDERARLGAEVQVVCAAAYEVSGQAN